MTKFFGGFIVAILLIAACAAALVYGGVYNIAASVPHSELERWALETAKIRSVESRADSISPPSEFTAQQRRAGFRVYDAMCVNCHGAPGREPGAVGKGLQPQPPDLAQAALHWNRSELYWIVNNGIKMTGMPAFGETHDEDQIWQIVAFLEQLPNTSMEMYTLMRNEIVAATASSGTLDEGAAARHGDGALHY